MNLVRIIKELEGDLSRREKAFEEEVSPIREAIASLRKINDTCERCEGKGKVLRSRVCAEDDRPDPNDPRDYIPCPVCHGTGKPV